MAEGSTGESRNVRLCEACGQVDDHPRHVVATRPGDSTVIPTDVVRRAINEGLSDAGVAEALDNSTTVLHMDCCAARGCPDGSCNQILERAGKRRHEDLTKFVTSGKVDDLGTASAVAEGAAEADGSTQEG